MSERALDPAFRAKLLEVLGQRGHVEGSMNRLILKLGQRARILTPAQAEREDCTFIMLAVSASLVMSKQGDEA